MMTAMRLLVPILALFVAGAPASLAAQAVADGSEALALIGELAPPGADGTALDKAQADRLLEAVNYLPAFDPERVRLYRLALAAYRRLLPPDAFEVEAATSPLAQLLMEMGRPAEAEELLRERLAHYETCCTLDSGGAFDYAARLAAALSAQERYGEARLLLDRLWAVAEPWDEWENDAVLDIAAARSQAMTASGDAALALEFADAAVDRARAAAVPDAMLLQYLNVFAGAALATGALDDALSASREAIAVGRTDWSVSAFFATPEVTARETVAAILERTARAAAAEPIRREILARTEANDFIPRQAELHRAATLSLALNLAAQGKDEAAMLFRRYGAARARIYGERSPQVAELALPQTRFLLERGRNIEALAPARLTLAARLVQGRRSRSVSGEASERATARERQEAAMLVVQAAWAASTP
jgi:hypothetical protein